MGKAKSEFKQEYSKKWIVSNPFVRPFDFSININGAEQKPFKIRKRLITYIGSDSSTQIKHTQVMKIPSELYDKFFVLLGSLNRSNRFKYDKSYLAIKTFNTIGGDNELKIPISSDVSNEISSLFDTCVVNQHNPMLVLDFYYHINAGNTLKISAMFSDLYQKIDAESFNTSVVYLMSIDFVNAFAYDKFTKTYGNLDKFIQVGNIASVENNPLGYMYTFWKFYSSLIAKDIMKCYSERAITLVNNIFKKTNDERYTNDTDFYGFTPRNEISKSEISETPLTDSDADIIGNLCSVGIISMHGDHYMINDEFYNWMLHVVRNNDIRLIKNLNKDKESVNDSDIQVGYTDIDNDPPFQSLYSTKHMLSELPVKTDEDEDDSDESEPAFLIRCSINPTDEMDDEVEDDEDPMKFRQSSNVTLDD